jgi:RNA polymerase sigma-B factor
MWGEVEGSPVFAAPGSNDYCGLIASTTNANSGSEGDEFQGPFNPHALCKSWELLAYKIAHKYRGKGIDLEDLKAAGLTGLVLASHKYNPDLGSLAFGGYAKYWITGEITALFKRKDPLDRAIELDAPLPSNKPEGVDGPKTLADKLAYQPHFATIDLTALSETDQQIIEARNAGLTLAEVGKAQGISAERVRQREARARGQIKGAVASACISDLTQRGDVLTSPRTYSWGDPTFRDTPPPQHAYCEPKLSRKIIHHRANAQCLADLRGNYPLRNPLGPYGGPVIHAWGRK